MAKRDFAFGKENFILIAVAVAAVLVIRPVLTRKYSVHVVSLLLR